MFGSVFAASASIGGVTSESMVSSSVVLGGFSSVCSSTAGLVGSRVGNGSVVTMRVGRGEGEMGTTGLG